MVPKTRPSQWNLWLHLKKVQVLASRPRDRHSPVVSSWLLNVESGHMRSLFLGVMFRDLRCPRGSGSVAAQACPPDNKDRTSPPLLQDKHFDPVRPSRLSLRLSPEDELPSCGCCRHMNILPPAGESRKSNAASSCRIAC